MELPKGFDLIDTLGQGGMGIVYLVYQRELARYVALKKLAPNWESRPKARERFVREARAAARLSHPGIVPILDIGETGEAAWYSMEYVEGGDLSGLLAKHGGKIPWPEAATLVAKVADAIQQAHAAGVAHRDLKPSNILLDPSGAPKVADFGLAWLAGAGPSDLTLSGEILGTPAYLAPEAISGGTRDGDARLADIYSLGALLFHLVAGRPPFVGEHPMSILGSIVNERAPRLGAVAQVSVPVSLEIICERCLEKKPSARYASAGELARVLNDCVGNRPGWSQAWRIRRRSLRVATALLLVLVPAGLVYWGRPRALPEAKPGMVQTGEATASLTVAVLPLEVRTSDENTTLLAAGLQDELISTLTRISDLRVIATRSVKASLVQPGDVLSARNVLGVGAVLTGSVQKDGEMLRISMQLIDTKQGTTLWSHGYTREETILFNLETEIATEVALQLRAHLRANISEATRGSSSSVPAAQNLFIRARSLMADSSASEAQLTESARLLNEAIRADPTFARAYAQLSLVHTQLYLWGDDRTQGRLDQGLRAAQDALRLNRDLAEAQTALGMYYFRGFRDYVTARPLLEQAQSLDPNNPETLAGLAHLERRQGNFPLAGKHFIQALDLDPLNAILAYNTADTFLRLREFETASRILEHSLELIPRHVALLKLSGDLHLVWEGNLGPMREDILHRNPALPKPLLYLMDKLDWLTMENRPEDALATVRASNLQVLEGQSVYFTRKGYEALFQAMANHPAEARDAAALALPEIERERAKRPNDARILLHAGQMLAILGNVEEAERLVRRTVTKGDPACVDAFDRGFFLRGLAILLAQAGQDQKALEVLRTVLREPNQTSVAYVALHPVLRRYSDQL